MPGRKNGSGIARLGTTLSFDTDARDGLYEKLLIRVSRLLPEISPGITSVPPSIRDAALGVGASKMQVTFHHVLPLALPGILTGTIIGVARALGETAPLLMIGMRAFVAAPPGGITDPATVLPVQIFLWSDEVDRGFVEKTSAAIIVLLLFMLLMNGIAIYLRNRFERRW